MSVGLHIVAEVLAAVIGAHRARGRAFDLDALRDQVRPIPGVEIAVPDGALLTGVVVVVENIPVVMLCARREPPRRHWSRPDAGPWSPPGPTPLSLWEGDSTDS